ncbi:MAG: hypothetical protein HY422_02620 [Candidatus Komeilibacteria bacterium]|nr:hypothetical protein [Candidatus Komeilibacteria bacterium]
MFTREHIIAELLTLGSAINKEHGENLAELAKRAVETAWGKNETGDPPTFVVQVTPFWSGEHITVSYYSSAKHDLQFIEIPVSELGTQ